MHFHLGTALIVVALASSVLMFLQTDRTVALVALVASGVEALLAFGLMSLSLAKFRIDIILPAMLAVAGVIAWARNTSKHAVTAAALVTLVGTLQLLEALRVMN
jgi:uncharacterized membrane protein YqgA involved in biofilm formation